MPLRSLNSSLYFTARKCLHSFQESSHSSHAAQALGVTAILLCVLRALQGTNARKHAGNNPQLNHAGVWFTMSLVPVSISGSVEAMMGIVCRGNPLQGMVHDGEYKVQPHGNSIG